MIECGVFSEPYSWIKVSGNSLAIVECSYGSLERIWEWKLIQSLDQNRKRGYILRPQESWESSTEQAMCHRGLHFETYCVQ